MKTENRKQKIENRKPNIRFLYDMKKVLYDRKWAKRAPDFPLYYMYRGIKTKNDLMYDITVIPPKMLGKEFTKTKGHYHLGCFGELYRVLSGQGFFLAQKKKDTKEIKDVYCVRARKGDYVQILPHYGHATINPSKKILKVANWISKKCKSDYTPFEKMRGGCYYYTKSGWIKNNKYGKIPKLRFKRPLKSMPKNLRSFL